jgi:hypothetical protein
VSVQVFSETQPVARKQHQCEQCLRPILKGERYNYYRGLFEGTFFVSHDHLDCRAASIDYAHEFRCYDEDWPFFHDMSETDDGGWMREKHPSVAARLGWALVEEEAP